MCRYPLEEFSKRIIKPYEKTLGVKSTAGIAEITKRKLQWTFGNRGEVAKLRDYLGIHIGIINMELLTAGLGGLGSTTGSMICQPDTQRELEESRVALRNLDSRVQNQSSLVRAMESSIASVLSIIRNDVLGSLKEVLQAATSIFSSTQQALFILLEIRSTLNGIQTQHTFFQAPVRVEDALGRVWPIPSEYSTADLHALIRNRFIGSPGQVDVEMSNYEVFYHQDHRQTIAAEANTSLIPGISVTMAVLFQSVVNEKNTCPVMTCRSSQSSETPGGGRKWETYA
ncbi:hypothetical protein QBC43DRAFT_10485 [Cladorrhinum sp. PSN259]|nr:hypothetical protein QBC43DRAFT_10485 [Cladorrhinum sp. PSN259]